MLTLANVRVDFGKSVALDRVSLKCAKAQTTCLIGPSGCGKSTVLRVLIGLVKPTDGVVEIDSEPVEERTIPKLRRRIGFVVQSGGLFPHLTAEQNVGLQLRHFGQDSREIAERIAYLSELVRLPATYLKRYPHELSGGQRQRVSLMRALMPDPDTLLLDEPMGALDPITRSGLQEELRGLFDKMNKTVVLVTHDLNEAAYLADSVVLMRKGQVIQAGTLRQLVREPADPFVEEFISAQKSHLDEAIR